MSPLLLMLPSSVRGGRVAHAGGREGRSVHVIVAHPVQKGHFQRAIGDPLCRPASRFAHLNEYAITSLSVAEACPQCLIQAVRLGILTQDQVRAAEVAYASSRIAPQPSVSVPSRPLNPWHQLPMWNEIPIDGTPAAAGPGARAFSRLAMHGRRLMPNPEPLRATLSGTWFYQRALSLAPGEIHKSPIILRLPAPQAMSDKVVILAASQGIPALRATPLARLGNDLVVSVSSYEVLLRFHQPRGFPGGISRYRDTLSAWHRYSLTDQARLERKQWRIETIRRLVAGGASEADIAGWMFERATYIVEISHQPHPSQT